MNKETRRAAPSVSLSPGGRTEHSEGFGGGAILAIIRRDLLLAMRRKSEVLTALFFFIIVASLFPLGIGPESDLLRKIAPGIIWVAALLATMLGLARLFAPDHADGTLEQMALSPTPLGLLVTGKIAAHWITTGLPLVLLAPVLGIQFDLDVGALGVLVVALLLGTPLLSLIGAIGAALTLGVRGGGVLLSLLVLPLYVPALIFGAGAVESHVSGLGAGGHLSLLAALLVLAVFFAPWAATAALRIALE
ncbi:MAG: heme exporter protein CcmB [Rhodocyclaceae bacterium]|nr:heme exporter protein CcmB [Rhodocyclaceae bacterium]